MTQWGLDTLFNPSKRHMDEEKARLQSTREEVGDASGGKRIDLDSGRVRISRTGIPEPVGSSGDDGPAGSATAIEASTATDDNAATKDNAATDDNAAADDNAVAHDHAGADETAT